MIAATSTKQQHDIHAECVRALLSHPNIEINQQSSHGDTALHAACLEGQQPDVAAQLLLSDHRCDVNV